MKLRYKIAGITAVLLLVAVSSLALVLSYSSPCPPAPVVPANAATMQAVVYRCYGSPDVLALETVERPALADDEVLIRVHAASVNPLDWHYMRGSPYFMRLMSGLFKPKDTRLGVDFAGTVEAVGPAVSRFRPGDEVFGGRTGAFAEYVRSPENRAIVMKPQEVSFEQAAAVPIAAITALQALRDMGGVKLGQKVLINGASGGVGTFAVQIAKAFGAEVTGVCSTRNLEMVRSIGADHVIDYTQQDFTQMAERYDLAVDMVGNHPPSAYRDVLEPDGTLVMVGGAKGNWIAPIVNLLKAKIAGPRDDQTFVGLMAELKAEDLVTLAELMQAGKVTSVIDRRFALSELPEAIRYSESGRARGKILVTVLGGEDPGTD